MQQPQLIGKEQTEELKTLCRQYPYFSVARMLYVKGLHNIAHSLLDTEILHAALFCPDRNKLYNLLYAPEQIQGISSNASEEQNISKSANYTEEQAISLIKAKKYEEALEILRVLHFKIPEKSVYFADQIRYLEKIIATINQSK